MRRYWVIAPYDSNKEELFEAAWNYDLKNGTIAIGWEEVGDVQNIDDEELKRRINKLPSGYEVKDPSYVFACFHKFYREISVGDIVIARRGVKQIIGIGEVTKTAYYDIKQGEMRVRREKAEWIGTHFINVKWKESVADLKDYMLARDTIVEVTPEKKYFKLILGLIDDEEETIKLGENELLAKQYLLLKKKKQIILYGPPGTGKTYNTKKISVGVIKSD
jgi:predicted Mrr-cat superfamily restriction endonuclease